MSYLNNANQERNEDDENAVKLNSKLKKKRSSVMGVLLQNIHLIKNHGGLIKGSCFVFC